MKLKGTLWSVEVEAGGVSAEGEGGLLRHLPYRLVISILTLKKKNTSSYSPQRVSFAVKLCKSFSQQ